PAPRSHRPEAAPDARRPGAVNAGLAITMGTSMLVGLVLLLVMGRALADKQGLFEQVREVDPEGRLGGDPNAVLSALLVACVVLVLWCVGVIGVSVAAARREEWARVVLVVSAGLVGLLSVVATVSAPPLGLVLLLASGSAFWLLLSPPSAAWYGGRTRAPRPPPPPTYRPPGPPPPPPQKPPVW
ncbi:MAG: hypothetical protein HOQ45_04510, partial [Nocardioidaceae bacterium]|nr:hypothetical protein [Nocardioidaceae bacterium]